MGDNHGAGKRARIIVSLLLASVLLAAVPVHASSEDPPVLTLTVSKTGFLVPGQSILVRVVVENDDGDPLPHRDVSLAPFGLTAVTNEQGLAVFRVLSATARIVDLVASVGASAATVPVTWTVPNIEILAAQTDVFQGQAATVKFRASWAHDDSPLVGVNPGLDSNAGLEASGVTNDTGVAELSVTRASAGATNVTLTFDEPWLREAPPRVFHLVWRPVHHNGVPSVASVSVTVEGATASARVGAVSDPDGDSVQIRYAWSVNGAIVNGARGAALAVEPGQVVRVFATPFDGRDAGPTLASEPVTVPVPNKSPVADAIITGERTVGKEITFDAAPSSDEDGTLAAIEWRFEDGTSLTGAIVTRVFTRAGANNVTLVVRDNAGATASRVFTLELARDEIAKAADDNATANETKEEDAPRFNHTSGGTVYELEAFAATEAAVVRALSIDGAPFVIVRAQNALHLWSLSSGDLASLPEAQGTTLAPRNEPGVLVTPVEGVVSNGWTYIRINDPQPGLHLAGVGAAAHWRESGTLTILARAQPIDVRHVVPALAFETSIEGAKNITRRDVTITALGGAPVESISIFLGGELLAESAGRTLALSHTFPNGTSTLRITARQVTGEVAEASVVIVVDAPPPPVAPVPDGPRGVVISPLGGNGSNASGDAAAATPFGGFAVVLGAVMVAFAAIRRPKP